MENTMENTETKETYESIMAPDPVEEVVDTPSNDVPEIDNSPEELIWDDEEPSDESPDKGTEVVSEDEEDEDDEELRKIEEKNKWMKERLAPTKKKLTRAEEEIARLRSELESFKANKPVDKVENNTKSVTSIEEYVEQVISNDSIVNKLQKDFEELENKDGVTNGELVRAAAKLEARKEILEGQVRSTIAYNQKQAIEYENKIADDFTKSVLAKKEEYPDIDKALSRVEKNAASLNIDIRRALIMNDEGTGINKLTPDLVNLIGNDKKALGYLIAQSKLAAKTGRTPVAALEYIGRLKSRIQNAPMNNMKAPDEDDEYTAPIKKQTLPKVIRNTPAGGDPVDLSSWAKEAVKRGERPW